MSTNESPQHEQPGGSGGISRRRLLGAALTGTVVGAATVAGGGRVLGTVAGSPATGRQATIDEPFVVDMAGMTLRRDDLLVTNQRDSNVLLIRDGRASTLLEMHTLNNAYLWDTVASKDRSRLYVSASGVRTPVVGQVGVRGSGAIIEIDVARGEITRVFTSRRHLTDPSGLVLSPDESVLYVADYNDFGKVGRISTVDLASGDVGLLSEGRLLRESTGISLDGDSHLLIGNANMPEGGYAGGSIVRIEIATGSQEMLHDQSDEDVPSAPSLIGAVRLASGEIVGARSEWPRQATSSIFKVTGPGPQDFENLYDPTPGFFGGGIAVTDSRDAFWVTESVRWEVLKIAADGRILERVQLDPQKSAEALPLPGAFETLESVKLVA